MDSRMFLKIDKLIKDRDRQVLEWLNEGGFDLRKIDCDPAAYEYVRGKLNAQKKQKEEE